MKKLNRSIQLLAFGLFSSVLVTNLYAHTPRETGSYSGATGESNCSSCHSAATSNSTFISLTGLPASYQAGTSYPLTLNFTASGTVYGFQITAAKSGASTKLGTWTIVNSGNTSLVSTTRVSYLNATSNKTWSLQWNAPATAGNGTVVFYVSAIAANNNGSSSGDPTHIKNFSVPETVVDTTLPTISIGNPTASATVSGTLLMSGTSSDNIAVSKVEVQIDGGALSQATGTTSWSKSIDTTALSNGSHTLTAKATDSSNNTKTTSVTITVNNVVGVPTLAITSPANGAGVTGTITISGTSADNSAVANVKVKIDNGTYQSATGTTNWSFSLNTATLSDGVHTITAQVTDDQSNTATSAVSVTVSNVVAGTPTLAITSPSNGATISGSAVSIAGTAADATSVSKVEIQVDGGSLTQVSGTTNWTYSLNTTGLSNGNHTLTAKATNSAANTKSVSITVNVNNVAGAPTIAIITPTNGASVSGVVSIQGTAADNGSVSSVQINYDGGLYYPVTGTTNWNASVNTTDLGLGAHTISLRATDNSGNFTDASISVVVVEASSLPPAVTDVHTYHNKFNPGAGEKMTFQATVQGTSNLAVRIYDGSGRLVRTLLDNTFNAGLVAVDWDGKDANGNVVGNGIYLCEIKSDNYKSVRKVAVVKR